MEMNTPSRLKILIENTFGVCWSRFLLLYMINVCDLNILLNTLQLEWYTKVKTYEFGHSVSVHYCISETIS
jgi:hypothetical protein